MKRYTLDVLYYRDDGQYEVRINLERFDLKSRSGCTDIRTFCGLTTLEEVARWIHKHLTEEFGHDYPIDVSLIFVSSVDELDEIDIDIGQSGDEMDSDQLANKFEIIDVEDDDDNDPDYDEDTAADAPDGCSSYSDGNDLIICESSSEEIDWEGAYYNGR